MRSSSERRIVRAASTADSRVVLAARGRAHPPQHVLARARHQAPTSRRGTARTPAPARAGRRRTGCAPARARAARPPPLVAQQPEVPVGGAELVADPPEGEQAGVGVGLVGEPAEHDRQQLALDGGPAAQPVGEGLDVRRRPRGSRKPRAASRSRAASGRQAHLASDEPGGRGEQRAVEEPLVQPAHLALLGRATARRPPPRVPRGGRARGRAGAGRSRRSA